MSVTVDVRLNGPLADRLGGRRSMRLPDGATVDDLVQALRADADADVNVVVSVGGRVVSGATTLADRAAVAVLVPHAGG